MDHLALIKYVSNNMAQRKLRSWLTVLGVVIGIAAIVVLMSVAQGLDTSIRDQLNVLGNNYIFIMPGGTSGMSRGSSFGPPSPTVLKGVLYNRDVEIIKRIAGVEAVSGMLSQSLASVEYRDETLKTSVSGIDAPAAEKFLTSGYSEGRGLASGDLTGCVIGTTVANDLFSKKIRLGDTLNIMGKDFKVRGIIAKVGGQAGAQFDNAIYIDLQAMRNLLGSSYPKNQVVAILAITKKDADNSAIAAEIERALANSHKVSLDKKDFTAITPEFIAQQISVVTGMLALFLGGIAAISLLVGGIGIANAMFTSVLERTREIGVLKALGASGNAVLEIFLIEAGVIGALGGVIGVALGMLISIAMTFAGLPSIISLQLVLFAVGFSIFIGIFSGYFPAKNASKLLPVEALRYE